MNRFNGKYNLKLFFALLFFVFFGNSLFAQLVLNEVSQGPSAAKEYIELIVIGNRSCSDSTADIRNWVIDDNNGWLGVGSGQGIALGSMRFSNIPAWQRVPYGSIILIYNNGDKNNSITLPDDPSDANNDYVYVVPASSNFLEKNIVTPSPPSSLNYVYPTTGFSPGGDWPTMGLANAGDAVVITKPDNLTAAYFSLGYGTIGNSSYATVFKSDAGSALCYYLNDNLYNISGSWIAGNAPANETPGSPNSTLNANWINSLRQVSVNNISRDTTTITGCSSVTYNGSTYTTSQFFTDTLRSAGGCDSVYHSVQILIQGLGNLSIVPSGSTTFCNGDSINLSVAPSGGTSYTYLWSPGNQVTPSITVTATGTYSVTISNAGGCSQSLSQTVREIVPVTQIRQLQGCGNVVYNTINYTASTIVKDTLRSLQGCDSLITTLNIIVNNNSVTNVADTINQGETFTLPSGTIVSTAGTYQSVLMNSNGCDSIINTKLIVISNLPCKVEPSIAFTPNGDGVNDVWKIYEPSGNCIKKIGVKVYNRYGSLVYMSDDYQNNWRGTYSNKPCPDGTYYSIFEIIYLDNRKVLLKGNVTILR